MKNPLHKLTDTIKEFSAKTAGSIGAHKSSTTLDILISRRWPEEKKVKWCLRNGSEIINQGETDNLSELNEYQTNARIIVWSPTADTLLIEAELPTRNRSKINQALPFVLEEQLLNAPEQEHLVYQIRSGLPLAVTVTTKTKIEQWLDGFRECGLRPPLAMYPQATGLLLADNNWSMTTIDNELLVKTSDYTGFACQLNKNQLPVQLANAIQALDDDHKPGKILYQQIDQDLDIAGWSDGLGIEIQTKKSDLWSAIQTSATKLNLLQGEFKPKRDINPALSKFIPAAVVFIAWLALSLFINIWEWQSLKAGLRNANSQMTQIFKTSFPDARTIVDPALQMQRKFEALSGGSGGYLKNDFIAILSRCSPALSALSPGAIENLRYNEKSLDISLGLADFKSLETLKERLSAIGMHVEVVAANSRSDGIEGRLKITVN